MEQSGGIPSRHGPLYVERGQTHGDHLNTARAVRILAINFPGPWPPLSQAEGVHNAWKRPCMCPTAWATVR